MPSPMVCERQEESSVEYEQSWEKVKRSPGCVYPKVLMRCLQYMLPADFPVNKQNKRKGLCVSDGVENPLFSVIF